MPCEAPSDLGPPELVGLTTYCGTAEARTFADALDAIIGVDVAEDRFDATVAWAKQHVGKRRVAVACSFPDSAAEAANRLEKRLGGHRVARLLSGLSEADRAAEVRGFLADADCTVLVLDHLGEEGTNLQVVDEVLHLDLPSSTLNLEQRLGRFDRWTDRTSRAGPVLSVVFADSDPLVDEQLGAWRDGLDVGVEIFDRSSATLQYVLPELEATFFAEALDRNFAEAGRHLAGERYSISAQRRRIEGQDILDALEDQIDDARYLQQLLAVESDRHKAERAFQGYLVGALGFTIKHTYGGSRYGISSRHPPQVCESEVMRFGPRNLEVPYVVDRDAVKLGSGFLRWGEPLVNALVDFAERDDRGRGFAVEVSSRAVPQETGPQFTFCFDIVVKAGSDALNLLADVASVRSASGRVLRFFAPTVERVWLTPGMGELPPGVVSYLERSEGINLGSRPDRFEELIVGLHWPELCTAAAEEALQIVARRNTVRRRLQEATTRAAEAREHDEAVWRARTQAGSNEPSNQAVLDAVDAAVADPQLTVDACGVIVLTPLEMPRWAF